MKASPIFLVILCAGAAVSGAANPQVTLEISGGVQGNITIELYPKEAPVTVANFIDYVQSGFYEGLIFHRVIENFMIQGGGFDTNGVKKATAPAIFNESTNGLLNLRGTVAMARTPAPHSATSQFFINQVDNSFLNQGAVAYDGNNEPYLKVGYCVFGRVVSGMDIVDAIAIVQTTNDQPDTDVIIAQAELSEDIPVCFEKLPGDLDGDCDVDLADFVTMAQNWLTCNSITPTCD